MKRVGLFPGTFDPVTLGHMDVMARALHLFDRLIVAVARRHQKETLFDSDERIEMIRRGLSEEQAQLIEVTSFEGLLVDFARSRRVSGIVRGLRFVSDFEYEFQMALMNQKLCPELDTILLMPTERFSFLNASLVKDVARAGGSVEGLVTPDVARRLAQKYAALRSEEAHGGEGSGGQGRGRVEGKGERS